MAYKITKYRGKHTLKDTKTGESAEIDIEKFFNGGGKDPKDKTVSLPDETNKKIAYANAKGLDMEQLNAFEDQDMSDENWRQSRDKYYGEYRQNWLKEGRNSKLSATSPEYKSMIANMQKSWYDQNQRDINETVLDYRYNGAANPQQPIMFTNEGMRMPSNSIVGMSHGGQVPKYQYGTTGPRRDYGLQMPLPPYQQGMDMFGTNNNSPITYPSLQQANMTPPQMQDETTTVNQQSVPGVTMPTDEDLDMMEMQKRTQQNQAFANQFNPVQPNTTDKSFDDILKEGAKEGRNLQNEQNYNVFNSYAGVDIPTAAYTLGQSIENKDTLGTVASSLKLATGLGRNIVGGLGNQNRYNQTMEEFYRKEKNNRNVPQYMAYGGKKDEEFATGEYMAGIDNENTNQFNAEIESGEYYQTNMGDIAEVVGNKHSSGGEKVNMETDDRVLSDKLKLGRDAAKQLSEKYELNLKAKNTYSDVLDKFRKKMKLDKLIDEESDIIKKLDEQYKVSDATTRGFNLQVLAEKKKEIEGEKHPIEEQRKEVFEELYNMQEDSKKGTKRQDNLAYGGNLESMAKEYGISIDRAKELVQQYQNGGDGRKATVKRDIEKTQSLNRFGYFGDVTPEEYERFVNENSSWYDFSNFDPTKRGDVTKFQEAYNVMTSGNRLNVDGMFGGETASAVVARDSYPKQMGIKEEGITAGRVPKLYVPNQNNDIPIDDLVIEDAIKNRRRGNNMGGVLFPDESPLPPSALQGTMLPRRSFDRISPREINVEPYLQDLRDRESAQVQSLEGLSPNVRASVLANMRANTNSQESQIRNQIDTQNLQSQERADQFNAQTQRMETNANASDRLAFEARQYRAQALTDNDMRNYYNALQELNSQRYRDIEGLNMVNANNEDVMYIPGRGYIRKTSDNELFDRATERYRK